MDESVVQEGSVAWFGGVFLPLAEVRISPFDRGFLFADGVYEAVRWIPDGEGRAGWLFALDRHLRRLAASLATVRIEGVTLDTFPAALLELIERNGLSGRDASIYLQITRGVAPRTHVFPVPAVTPTVLAIARAYDPPRRQWEVGVEVVVVEDLRWGRCDIKSISLLPNVLASEEARSRGGHEALFVRDGMITEGAHTAVVAVRNGQLVAPPEGPEILPSVTREFVLEIASAAGIPIELRRIPQAELAEIDELMILGTTTEITPVVRVDGADVASGVPGPITRRLQAGFQSLAG